MDEIFEILVYVVLIVIVIAVNVGKAVKRKSVIAESVPPTDADGGPIFTDILSEEANDFPVEKNNITEIEDQKSQSDYNLSSNLIHRETRRKEQILKNTKNENSLEKERVRSNMFKKAIIYSAIIKRPYD